jgi:hypothetical protein
MPPGRSLAGFAGSRPYQRHQSKNVNTQPGCRALPNRMDHPAAPPTRARHRLELALCRRPPEAYRLAGIERRELHIADLSPELTWDSRIANRVSLDDQLEARDALRAVAQLAPRQRHDLTLFVAGFSYHDIAEMTGGRTYTNVNKHLTKARAGIRLTRG